MNRYEVEIITDQDEVLVIEVFADTPEEALDFAIEKVETGEAEIYGQIVVCAEVL